MERSRPVVDPGFTTSGYCEHRRHELRRRVYANGVTHFVHQCLRCGASGRSIKRDLAFALGGDTARPFDDVLADEFWEQERADRVAEAEASRKRRREDYGRYLVSPEWRERRRLRLESDRFVCQARLPGCRTRATEVHHLTYRFVGNEPLFDLVSLCGFCHRAISAMEGRVDEDEGLARVAAD